MAGATLEAASLQRSETLRVLFSPEGFVVAGRLLTGLHRVRDHNDVVAERVTVIPAVLIPFTSFVAVAAPGVTAIILVMTTVMASCNSRTCRDQQR
jgi:hypothetical protein